MVDQQESVTAKLCAFARAWHAVRVREKIFDDDLAFDIMGKEEYDAMFEFVRRGFSAEGDILAGTSLYGGMSVLCIRRTVPDRHDERRPFDRAAVEYLR